MTGLGAILQQAREARGVSLEEAERVTHIARRYLQGLEDEDFSVFPAPVFARGFLRNYSQYLGLDPDEIAGLWPGNGDQPPPRPEPPPETGRSEFERRTRPLRERTGHERTGVHRVYGSRSGRAPGPLSRGVAGRGRQAPVRPALLAVGVAVLLLLLVAFVASRTGGSSPRTATNAPGGLPAGGSQPRSSPTAPPRSAGKMPDLVGKSQQAALAQLQQAGITPLVVGVTSTSKTQPAGAVLRQDPPAGTAITTNSSVSLIVNGPVEVAPSATPPAGATPRSTATPRATATPRVTR